jgi:hypothetical protein
MKALLFHCYFILRLFGIALAFFDHFDVSRII